MPTRPRPPRLFYGWVIVAIAFVCGALSNGVAFWAVGALAVPMTTDLGWSRSAYFGAMTVRSLLSGLSAPVLGPLQDRRLGPRLILLGSGVSLGVAVMGLAAVTELWQLYLLFGVLGSVSVIGANDMLSGTVVPKWFVRRRGIALSVATAGTAMGALLAPAVIALILAFTTWRDAWLLLGGATLLVVGGLSLLVRTRPEDVGLLPDGEPAPPPSAGLPAPSRHADEPAFTRGQAMRSRTFWLIVLAWSLSSIGLGGFHIQWLPYFSDLGFSLGDAALATTVYGLGSVTGRFLWGFTTTRYSVRRLLTVQSLLTGLSVAVFGLLIVDVPTMVLAAGCHGLAVGGFFVLRPLHLANTFGRQNLGAVSGAVRPFVTFANAFGPVLIGGFYDVFGAYTWAFWVVVACWVVSAMASHFTSPPARAPQQAAVVTA